MTGGLGQLASRTFVLPFLNSHRLSLFGGVVFAPVLKRILVHLKVDFHHAGLNSLLHFGNRRVAYRLGWLQQLAHAQARLYSVADGLIEGGSGFVCIKQLQVDFHAP